MTQFRLILLLAAVCVPTGTGFVQKKAASKPLKPEHLKYINREEIAIQNDSVLVSKRGGHKRQRNQKQTNILSGHGAIPPQHLSHAINNRHSASDWLYNLRTLPNSSVLREIRNPVITLTCWGTLLSVIHKLLLVKGKLQMAANMSVPMVAHSLLVSSLGLLLVFRTNSSYQRFLEGRKIWESILTTSRNLSRLAMLYRDDVGSENLARIRNLIASFPYLLRHHIRSGCLCSMEPETVDDRYKLALYESSANLIETRYEGDKVAQLSYGQRKCFVDRRNLPWKLLDDPKRDTLLQISRSTNRPLWICDRLGLEITKIPYNNRFTSRERLTFLKSIDDLANSVGQCERIRQTCVPLNYARHALRSLTLWLFTLPFCLVADLGLMTGPATGVIAWVLFGVYQIGHSIEDPFEKSLRLSILCDAIRRDVLDDDRYSAFYIEEDDAEDLSECKEPHSLKGLNGKVGDFLAEADLNILTTASYSLPTLVSQPQQERVVA